MVAATAGCSEPGAGPQTSIQYRVPTEVAHHDDRTLAALSSDSVWLLAGLGDGAPREETPAEGASLPEAPVPVAAAAEVTVPTRTPPPPAGGIDDWLAAGGWPEYLWPEARAVAWCESRWNPAAVGDSGRSVGLFQLWRGWFGYTGQSADDWADPVVNARAAWGAYQYSGGWQQWSCKP